MPATFRLRSGASGLLQTIRTELRSGGAGASLSMRSPRFMMEGLHDTPDFIQNGWLPTMAFRSPRHRRSLLQPEPWLAALVVIGMLVSGGGVNAASWSPSSAIEDDHGESCHCGSRCRQSACCCGPSEPRPTPRTLIDLSESEEEPAASSPVEEDSGPCLGAMPCGDPAAPTGSSASVVGKSAALGLEPGKTARESRRLHVRPTPVHPPARRSARLDRPPRIDASA